MRKIMTLALAVLLIACSPKQKTETKDMNQLSFTTDPSADSWMQHLAIHTQEQPDATNEWLEPVSDEQYNKLTAF